MEAGNGEVYKLLQPYAIAVTGAALGGSGVAAAATTTAGRAFLAMLGIGAEAQSIADGAPPGGIPTVVVSGTKAAVGGEIKAGQFSISNWSGYPAGVPQPSGPFRLLGNAEYQAARKAANSANKALRKDQGLVGNKTIDIHEIQPVKFDGSPTDAANKIGLDRTLHRQEVTPWWNALQRALESVP